MKSENKAKLELISSMLIFGTIGIFVRYIPLPSSIIALARAVIGVLFLMLFMIIRGKKVKWKDIRNNLFLLLFSGVLIGVNWILLFESYRYTTVATATLCYYLAPVFVIVLSPFILREKITARKILCVLIALIGMFFVSGVSTSGISGIKGILYGIGAAVLYAIVVLCNQKIQDISAYDKTVTQLTASAIVLLPYVFFTENINAISISFIELGLLIVVGILHTGIAYTLYFASMKDLNAATIAIFSYIDPVVAIILSVILLRENMGITGVLGAVLILGATLFSSLPERKKTIDI